LGEKREGEITRRSYLKYSAGLVAAAAIGAAAGYGVSESMRPPAIVGPTQTVTVTQTATAAVTPTAPATTLLAKPKTPLVWMGGSWAIYPEVVDKWKAETGIDVEWTAMAESEMLSRMMATRGYGIDLLHPESANASPFIEAEPPIVQPIPVEKIPRWKAGDVAKMWTEPETTIGMMFGSDNAEYIARTVIKPYTWWKGREGEAFALIPRLYNFDSVCYNPEFIDHEVKSWGEMMDRQYKGKVSIQDVFVIAINEWANYLVRSGQMAKPEVGINDLTPSELNVVIDFLIKHKKAGQIKALWSDYGAAVNFHTTREVWISDGWQPVEFSVRMANVPAYYAECDEGYRSWFSGEMPSVGTDKLEWCFRWIDFNLSGWYAGFIAGVGYSLPNYLSQEFKTEMGPEYYGWVYEGKRTYKPVSEIIPNKDEWIARALFLPVKKNESMVAEYAWSKTPGTESADGTARDGGSQDRHINRIGTWQRWPKYASEYAAGWDRFKAA